MAKESGAIRSRLSHLARPFTVERSSSIKIGAHDAAASGSLPGHDSGHYEYETIPSDGFIWDDYAFDYSCLISDEHMSVGEDLFCCKDKDIKMDPKGETVAESSKLFDHVDHAAETKEIRMDFKILERTNAESVPDSSNFSFSYPSDASRLGDSQKKQSVALPVISTSHLNSDVSLEERCSEHVSPTSVLGDSDVTSLVSFVSSDDGSGVGPNVAKRKSPHAKETSACFDKTLADPDGEENKEISITNKALSPMVSPKPNLRIVCHKGSNIKKSDLYSGDASVSEKYSIPSDLNDSDVDSPCWKGIQARKSAVGALQVSLSAPEVIVAIPEVAIPVPEVAVPSSQVAVSAITVVSSSHPTTLEHSNKELNGRHRLNPLAPHFVPSNARQDVEMPGKGCDRVGSSSLQETGFSTAVLSSGSHCYPTKVPEVRLATKDDFNNYISAKSQEPTLVSMTDNMDTNFGLASKLSSSKPVSLHQSDNDFQISKRLNPTARQFVPFNAKQAASDHEKEVARGNLIGVRTIMSSSSSLAEGNLQPSALMIQPSDGVHKQQMECVLSNKSWGSSKLKSPVTEQPASSNNYFMSNSMLLSMPSASYSVKDTAMVQPTLSHGLSKNTTASSSWRVERLFDLSHQLQNWASQSSPAELDVKKLLVTMYELSELLIHGHERSYDLDLPSEQEYVLVNNIMKNLNLYMGNGAPRFSSSDSSHLHASFESELKGNTCKDFPSGFLQENYRIGEEIDPPALFYRSLWLKAEASRCLAEFEACLSRIKK